MNWLNQHLRRQPIQPGGGGGGGGGGSGGPGIPGGGPLGPNVAFVLVPVANDIRTMGQLPPVFLGDRTKADDFVEQIKTYLQLNHNVPGFNSPIK
jgi:hypothetical protein